jgi:hypothetical protein
MIKHIGIAIIIFGVGFYFGKSLKETDIVCAKHSRGYTKVPLKPGTFVKIRCIKGNDDYYFNFFVGEIYGDVFDKEAVFLHVIAASPEGRFSHFESESSNFCDYSKPELITMDLTYSKELMADCHFTNLNK